jgi:hypothetical protein
MIQLTELKETTAQAGNGWRIQGDWLIVDTKIYRYIMIDKCEVVSTYTTPSVDISKATSILLITYSNKLMEVKKMIGTIGNLSIHSIKQNGVIVETQEGKGLIYPLSKNLCQKHWAFEHEGAVYSFENLIEA